MKFIAKDTREITLVSESYAQSVHEVDINPDWIDHAKQWYSDSDGDWMKLYVRGGGHVAELHTFIVLGTVENLEKELNCRFLEPSENFYKRVKGVYLAPTIVARCFCNAEHSDSK